MSAVAGGISVACLQCGDEFEAPDRRRLYCFKCSPPGRWVERKRSVVPALRVVDSAATPFSVEHFADWASELVLDSGEQWVIEPFQLAFAADVLGSAESRRLDRVGIKEAWLVVPEGNGKSTLLAGLALYHCEFRQDGLVPVAASSRDQAKIIYRQAKGFVRRTERLNQMFRCFDGYRRITHVVNDSMIEVFAADDRTGDGVIPSLALVDELHRHRSLDLYETWTGKLDKLGAQILVISTAGEPGSPFEEARERMRQVADETEVRPGFTRGISDEQVIHDWAISEDGDPEDMEQVKAANPFSGVTVDRLERKRKSPTMSLPHWRRFVCNLPTRGGLAAVTEAEWFAAAVENEIPAGEPIWLGLDLAFVWDTTALVPLWWRDSSYRLLGQPVILEPPRNGDQLDSHLIEAALLDLHERNPIHTVVMDPSKAEQLAQWIDETIGCLVVKRAQTNSFACADYAAFMEALRLGQLHHTGHPGLTKHVLNATAKLLPGGDTRFDRPVEGRRSGEQPSRVIDALTAASMVHSEATMREAFTGDPLVGWG